MCRKKTNFPNVNVILTLTDSPPYGLTTVLYDSAITGNAAERNFAKLMKESKNRVSQNTQVITLGTVYWRGARNMQHFSEQHVAYLW